MSLIAILIHRDNQEDELFGFYESGYKDIPGDIFRREFWRNGKQEGKLNAVTFDVRLYARDGGRLRNGLTAKEVIEGPLFDSE